MIMNKKSKFQNSMQAVMINNKVSLYSLIYVNELTLLAS